MSTLHTNTFLRSALANDPYCLGSLGIEEFLRIQNEFPSLFENDQPGKHREEEESNEITKTQSAKEKKKKEEEKEKRTKTEETSNSKKIIAPKMKSKSSSNLPLSRVPPKPKKAPPPPSGPPPHYELPVKCNRTRCKREFQKVEKDKELTLIANASTGSLYNMNLLGGGGGGSKKINGTKSNPNIELKRPSSTNLNQIKRAPTTISKSPYKEPLVDNYLRYVKQFYSKGPSAKKSETKMVQKKSSGDIQIEEPEGKMKKVQRESMGKLGKSKCLEKTPRPSKIDLKKSADELVDQVVDNGQKFTPESKEKFEQFLLAKILASKYEEFGQFEDQPEREDEDSFDSCIDSLMEIPQRAPHNENLHQNLPKTNILVARCVAGRDFDEFEFFEEGHSSSGCSSPESERDEVIEDKNGVQDYTKKGFRVTFNDIEDRISPSARSSTISSTHTYVNNSNSSSSGQSAQLNQRESNSIRDQLKRSADKSLQVKMNSNSDEKLLDHTKWFIREEVESFFRRNNIIRNDWNGDLNLDIKTPTSSTKSHKNLREKVVQEEVENYFRRNRIKRNDLNRDLDLDVKTPTSSTKSHKSPRERVQIESEEQELKTPELTPPFNRKSPKSRSDKARSSSKKSSPKTPEQTPPSSRRRNVQEELTDCSEISEFVFSDNQIIPEREKSTQLVTPRTPRLTPGNLSVKSPKTKSKSCKTPILSKGEPSSKPLTSTILQNSQSTSSEEDSILSEQPNDLSHLSLSHNRETLFGSSLREDEEDSHVLVSNFEDSVALNSLSEMLSSNNLSLGEYILSNCQSLIKSPGEVKSGARFNWIPLGSDGESSTITRTTTTNEEGELLAKNEDSRISQGEII